MRKEDRADFIKIGAVLLYSATCAAVILLEDSMSSTLFYYLQFFLTIVIPICFCIFALVYLLHPLVQHFIQNYFLKHPVKDLQIKLEKTGLDTFFRIYKSLITISSHPNNVKSFDLFLLDKIRIEYSIFLYKLTSFLLDSSPMSPSIDLEMTKQYLYDSFTYCVFDDFTGFVINLHSNGTPISHNFSDFVHEASNYYDHSSERKTDFPFFNLMSSASTEDILINHIYTLFLNRLFYLTVTDSFLNLTAYNRSDIYDAGISALGKYLPPINKITTKYIKKIKRILRFPK